MTFLAKYYTPLLLVLLLPVLLVIYGLIYREGGLAIVFFVLLGDALGVVWQAIRVRKQKYYGE